MRNNPYYKNLKEQMPLFMQGPSSINALISNEEQKNFVEKAMIPPKKDYEVRGVSFTMISPPVLNLDVTFNTESTRNVEMGQTEVTQELFEVVMGWNDSDNKNDPKNPVEKVTWHDCISFCNKLSNLLGFEECYNMTDIEKLVMHRTQIETKHIKNAKVTWNENKNGFRLPTQKEWIFFAKAGTNNKWSGTDYEYDLDQYDWYNVNSSYETHPVAQLRPNEWGLYDMSGNVQEWCWDLYDPEYEYEEGELKEHVVRGGSSWYIAHQCKISHRSAAITANRFSDLGFRLCRSTN